MSTDHPNRTERDYSRLFQSNDLQLYTYFSSDTMMNTYVVWHKDRREAMLIDPVILDSGLFEILEGNNLEVTAVLLTHHDEKHFSAVKTIPKIYHHAVFYGGGDSIFHIDVENVKETPRFHVAGFAVDPIFLPGHYSDSLMYLLNGLLFTGDILSAGNLVLADDSYGRALMAQCIRESVYSLTDHSLILPLYGPPSTVAIEKETNIIIQDLLD